MNAESVQGDLANGMTLTFTYPQHGHQVELGRLVFLEEDPLWMGSGHTIEIGENHETNRLVILEADGDARSMHSGGFYFNCGEPEDCN